jgi:predicted RNA-binding protein with PUA-like domain
MQSGNSKLSYSQAAQQLQISGVPQITQTSQIPGHASLMQSQSLQQVPQQQPIHQQTNMQRVHQQQNMQQQQQPHQLHMQQRQQQPTADTSIFSSQLMQEQMQLKQVLNSLTQGGSHIQGSDIHDLRNIHTMNAVYLQNLMNSRTRQQQGSIPTYAPKNLNLFQPRI